MTSVACRLGYHDWKLYLPVGDVRYAKCADCGRRTTDLKEVQANLNWQMRQIAKRHTETPG